MTSYDRERVAAFFDDYGEREWTRFEDGRTPAPSLDVHLHYLRRYVRPGDRVLDVGAGPGRFTIELARIGARVVDISPGQLELNRERVTEAGLILDLARRDGLARNEEVLRTGLLCDEPDYGHLSRVEIELTGEPGVIDAGQHILAVLGRNA